MNLVNVSTIIPEVILDLRYATNNNVCGRRISNYKKAYLTAETAYGLKNACDILQQKGFRLVIWDAARTRETQEYLRNVCSDSSYVAQISKHNKGVAIDVTLADKEGKLLDLGTDFDDFSKRAHADNNNFSPEVLKRRKVLVEALVKNGFHQLQTEWWHFEYIQTKNHNVSNLKEEKYVVSR